MAQQELVIRIPLHGDPLDAPRALDALDLAARALREQASRADLSSMAPAALVATPRMEYWMHETLGAAAIEPAPSE